MIEEKLVIKEITKLNALYPIKFTSPAEFSKWNEISNISAKYQHSTFNESLYEIIELNCEDLDKLQHDTNILIKELSNELSDLYVNKIY